ncbi:MAG: hypothetical protein NPIRA06_34230 [Nitrospirales bacterium]|nr:MAG: hypothetical protein NPIRA06_34230 [Nitrospirales bacterium]
MNGVSLITGRLSFGELRNFRGEDQNDFHRLERAREKRQEVYLKFL